MSEEDKKTNKEVGKIVGKDVGKQAGQEVDRNKQFRQIADTFIDVANNHIDNVDSSFVSSSMLYGTSRFCSFVVASGCENAEHLEANREEAIRFYTEEFKRMLSENLNEYKNTFKEPPRYEHLMKK